MRINFPFFPNCISFLKLIFCAITRVSFFICCFWRRHSFGTMKFLMFTFIRKQLKIFYSVIIFNFITMMDNFLKFKVSSKMFFHNKARIFYITRIVAKRMIWLKNNNISLISFIFTTFPVRMIFTKILSFYKTTKFITLQTFFHNYLQIKRAAFRSLIEKRLSFLTLLTADYRQRKIASLLANISIPQFNIDTRIIYG